MDFIRAEDLTYEYIKEDDNSTTRIKALDRVCFSVKKGSFTAIIGQNGSGKSTLAKNINAILAPTSGKLFVDGLDTSDDRNIWDIRQRVAMVFQNPDNQIVSSIVEEDVAFGPENLGIESSEIRRRVDQALRDVGMYEFRNKEPHNLSGGQKQRIAIAGAIAMRPECIVFDEPTSMLDPKGRKDVLNVINKINAEGFTSVLITHFMEEAALADNIIVLHDGHVMMQGDPIEIFKKQDELRKINLDVPPAVELAGKLRERGINIPPEIIKTDELVEYICQLK